jgi:hypothetical protein
MPISFSDAKLLKNGKLHICIILCGVREYVNSYYLALASST